MEMYAWMRAIHQMLADGQARPCRAHLGAEAHTRWAKSTRQPEGAAPGRRRNEDGRAVEEWDDGSRLPRYPWCSGTSGAWADTAFAAAQRRRPLAKQTDTSSPWARRARDGRAGVSAHGAGLTRFWASRRALLSCRPSRAGQGQQNKTEAHSPSLPASPVLGDGGRVPVVLRETWPVAVGSSRRELARSVVGVPDEPRGAQLCRVQGGGA